MLFRSPLHEREVAGLALGLFGEPIPNVVTEEFQLVARLGGGQAARQQQRAHAGRPGSREFAAVEDDALVQLGSPSGFVCEKQSLKYSCWFSEDGLDFKRLLD